MKLTWSKDRQSVVLIAETPSEVVVCDFITVDLNAHRYMTATLGKTIIEAKYTIIPEDVK